MAIVTASPEIDPLTFEIIPRPRRDPLTASVLMLVDVPGNALRSPLPPSWAVNSLIGPGSDCLPSPSQLNWSSTWVPDEIVNDYKLEIGNTVLSSLISMDGLTVVALSVQASPLTAPFDPSEIFVAILSDIDGTEYETPPGLQNATPGEPAVPLVIARPEFGGPDFSRVLVIPSYLTAGFRVWFYSRNPGAPASITLKIKTA